MDNPDENGIIVSDHAIVRYFERVMEMDVEQIKINILHNISAMEKLKVGKFPCDGGGRAVLLNNTIVTVVK
jgi:hypothetical protein